MTMESGNVSDNEKKAGENSNQNQPQSETEKLLQIIAEQNKLMGALGKRIEQLEKTNGAGNTQQGISKDEIIAIAKGVAEVSRKELNYEEGIDESQIDPDDFDEKGVRFTSPSGGYCLTDDRRKGQIVKLPYGKKSVFFEHASTRRVYQGKYEAITPISSYTSHSKKEIEWIRNHSLYGIMFYETTTQSAHADAIKATKLARIMGVIKNYEHVDLIKVCRQYGSDVAEDPAVTRANLAIKILEKEMESEMATTNRVLEDTYKHQLVRNPNFGKK